MTEFEKLIKDKGYNVHSLSIKIGVPRTSIANIITRKGLYKFRIDYAKKIADELHMTLDELYVYLQK